MSEIHIYQDNEVITVSHDSEQNSYYVFEK